MVKKLNQRLTLEHLAGKIDNGFKLIDKKSKNMRTEINEDLGKRLEKFALIVKSGFDGVDKRFDEIYIEINKLNLRIDSLQSDTKEGFERNDSHFREMQAELNDLKKHLVRVEKSTFEDTDALAEEVATLEKRVTKLELKAASN
jgi:uncharacterized protein YdcH (DUF465 family)